MTKRQRSFLFLSLLLLFLLIVPSIILYSQGYRIDLESRRITQTGAFYFKIVPNRVDIFVGDELVKKTDFLFGSALTKNFFPNPYVVTVAKEGYISWEKILEVKEKEVTEAKNIILFPQELSFQALQDNIENFWPSPDGKNLLIEKRAPDNTWELSVFSLQTHGEKLLRKQRNSKEEVWSVTWSPNSKRILLRINKGEIMQNTIWDKDGKDICEENPCNLDFLGEAVGEIVFSHAKEDNVVFTRITDNSQILLESNYITEENSTPLGNNIVAFTIYYNDIFWLEENGIIWKKSLTSDSLPQTINLQALSLKKETEYEILVLNGFIFLKENNRFLQIESEETKELLGQVQEISISPDGRKIAIVNNKELWLYFLQNQNDQPHKRAGEKIFLTRLSEEIKNLSWLSSHYLLFSLKDTIKAMEIDNRDKLNTADLGEFSNAKIYWQESQKVLYVLSKGKLFASEKLF